MAINNIIIAIGKEDCCRQDVIEVERCSQSVEQTLVGLGYTVKKVFIEKKDFVSKKRVLNKVADCRADRVFNLFEGFSDDSFKEIEFIKILEAEGILFTGNASATLKICRDKFKVKEVLSKEGVAVPEGKLIKRSREVDVNDFNLPVFIKPCYEDASLGIDKDSLVIKKEYLVAVIKDKLRQFPQGVLVEEFISGKEYTLGMMGKYPYEMLGVSVIDYAEYKKFSPFLTYRAKWEYSSKEFKEILPKIGGRIDRKVKKEIIRLAKETGRILSCRGYFRVDFREKEGKLVVIDANPNPDINKDSGFIKQARAEGLSYSEVISKIISFGFKQRYA
ncbi:MAG: ATP-grasp domain-containing protein [Candidatus Omnitrophota bacterium]|nr:ATP-grasp domain-containing protein [Candidatus Omnitrophota bacterium]